MTPKPDLSREDVWKMFDRISPTYDATNRVISLGMDQRWRKKIANHFPEGDDLHLLDLATGTGDQIIALMEKSHQLSRATGIDLAEDMLEIGKKKLSMEPYKDRIEMQRADAQELPFSDSQFHVATMTFGIRNVPDVSKTLREIQRVLKLGGRLLLLEFSIPSFFLIRIPYLIYLRYILPKVGKWMSKDPHAYAYLNKTIETFPSGQAFLDLLKEAGFSKAKRHSLMLGSVTLYEAEK